LGPEGGPKLWLVHRLLRLRRERPEAFSLESGYRALAVDGPKADHAVAFCRTGGVVVVVPRLVVGLGGDWAGTTVGLPEGGWTDVFTGNTVGGSVALADLLAGFPVAVLAGR
jgi:(1->4)-alpha-D-glucan 1-alpha-D-glucosylmutase